MKKLIIANWKCNPTTLKEAQKMLAGLKAGLKNAKAEVVICPPFVYLSLALKLSGASSFARRRASFGGLAFGSQNCFWEIAGAYTGEISPEMLKDLGVKYVILGHSERVMVMNETNEMTAKKVKAVLKAGILPIVCIGETIEERKQGKTFLILEKELKESLQGVKAGNVQKVIVAYEPLWAIGTGNNCSADDALTAALFVRKLANKLYGKKASQGIKILYGGSVDVANAKDYLQTDAINGLLVGGSALNIKEFMGIVKSIN